MKLVHPDYEFVFDFKEGVHHHLIIEQPEIFRNYITELLLQEEGEDGAFVLSEGNEELEISKNLDIMTDVLRFDPIDKKVTTKITSMLKSFMTGETMFERTSMLATEIESYAIHLTEEFPYSITYDNFDVANLVKLINFRPAVSFDSLAEKAAERMKLLHEICNISVFVLVNAFSYFTNDEIYNLIEEANLEKHNLLFIDSTDRQGTELSLVKVIIDKDGCEIFR